MQPTNFALGWLSDAFHACTYYIDAQRLFSSHDRTFQTLTPSLPACMSLCKRRMPQSTILIGTATNNRRSFERSDDHSSFVTRLSADLRYESYEVKGCAVRPSYPGRFLSIDSLQITLPGSASLRNAEIFSGLSGISSCKLHFIACCLFCHEVP